jgi:hypothetical protein
LKESDQLVSSFITPFGMYSYVTMSFGLRNAGATYQRCMQHVFGDHIGRTVEAYVDDIVVKTRKAENLVDDLRITFGCLRANRVKLNPEKCVFGMPRGMIVDGKNLFNVSIGLASVQVTDALLHLREIPRFVNPRSKGIAST